MSSTSYRENAIERFFHQTLPSWDPKLTVKNTALVFVLIGVIFIFIGATILYLFRNVQEIEIDYTYCNSTTDANQTCADIIGNNNNNTCKCQVSFQISDDVMPPVYLYYALTNFYQNHRSYVLSKDNHQLIGQLSKNVSKECTPYAYVNVNGTVKPIAPCGAIANSMFNDQLGLFYNDQNISVPLIRTNITWPTLKQHRFKNPPGDLKEAFKDFAKPINWTKNIWELDPEDPSNNGLQNEDFIVWMQPATMPSFKKIYRRVNHTSLNFTIGLPKGNYTLLVNYSFPTAAFKGTKGLVIANTSIFGTKNNFLGVAYLIVGFLCIMIALSFYIIQYKYKKYVKNN